MAYDFETRIDRRGTSCAKWDLDERITGRSGLLPFWVADMDFRIAPEIMSALEDRLNHGVFGYTERPETLDESLIQWFGRRYNWKIDRKQIIESPGIVPFVHMAVQNFTSPGDCVVIQEPVYYPFRKAIEKNNRKVVNNPLIQADNGVWRMDLDDLEAKIDESGASLLIFCSPHNPVGRVWIESELLDLASLCRRKGVMVISDEIHADLVHPGHRHIPWQTLDTANLPLSITLVSATKTFNLPGLTTAYAIVTDSTLARRVSGMLDALGVGGGSSAPLSYSATEAAWRDGQAWLDALLLHVEANDRLLRHRLSDDLPEVKVSCLEGTYLEWLDVRNLGMDDETVWSKVLDAGVWPSRGRQFGIAGAGHLRMNIACPRSQLEEGLDMLISALTS